MLFPPKRPNGAGHTVFHMCRVRGFLPVEVELGIELVISLNFSKHLKFPKGAQK